jgi:phage terminase large subunit-like protein
VRPAGGTIRRGLVVNGEGNPEQGDGRLNIATTASGSNVMLEWACRGENDPSGPPDDLTDMRVVKLANPASFVTPASLQDALEAPGITPWDFARYRANVWTLAFRSWIPTTSWDVMLEPALATLGLEHRLWDTAGEGELRAHIRSMFKRNQRLFVAVDMARYRDCAAIGLVAPREDAKPVVAAIVWESGGHDHPVSYDAVEEALRDLHTWCVLEAVGYDPKYFDRSAETLWDENLPMEEFPQSDERMCPAAADAREAIIGARWAHDGDPILKAHMLAGSAKDKGANQFKVVKAEESGPPIDAGIAVLMAHALYLEGSVRSVYEDADAKM